MFNHTWYRSRAPQSKCIHWERFVQPIRFVRLNRIRLFHNRTENFFLKAPWPSVGWRQISARRSRPVAWSLSESVGPPLARVRPAAVDAPVLAPLLAAAAATRPGDRCYQFVNIFANTIVKNGIFDQKQSQFLQKKLIITLVFEKNAIFFAEICDNNNDPWGPMLWICEYFGQQSWRFRVLCQKLIVTLVLKKTCESW
jgi:hypothetical protein